eukprot:CAMPEP_0197451866 /NCGR_PEP_ID=MMETSP1175-20131217/30385_1 /TAXON_ID=1003142 /ORGANISM="Triceratium dubium, Strain CCMP147" /LENGTH=331 /DNA_ID=CAMNT_0042984725 /DNA_START=121 /DNA_END=1116 /DNA_ORIENTATION=+
MAKPKVYVTRQFFDEPVALLKTVADVEVFGEEDDPIPRDLLKEKIADASGIIPMLTDKIDGELMDLAPQLRVVSNYAVGYNNIVVPDATARGIMVTNTPDVLNDSTADCAFMLLMAAARRLVEVDRYVRDGKWVRAWGPKMLLGSDVSGKTLGIVGMGRIGRGMVPRAQGFNMRVLYNNRNRLGREEEEELGVEYRTFDDLLKESDFVSLHVPLGGATEHIISERELKLMKKSAFLINTARGPVVDEKALTTALRERWIAGAGLDVLEKEPTPPDNPLLTLDNVVVAPHIGSSTMETRLAMAMRAAENVVAALKDERPRDLVNPEVLETSR